MTAESRVIVCAVDGSTADAAAIDVAAQLAVLADARLALLAVAPVPIDSVGDQAPPPWTLEDAKRALERTAAAVDDRVGVDCYLDAGNPVRRLVEFAGRTRPLLVVVGTRARDPALPPSIGASGLIRGAPCPVVVVPEAGYVPELDDRRRRDGPS